MHLKNNDFLKNSKNAQKDYVILTTAIGKEKHFIIALLISMYGILNFDGNIWRLSNYPDTVAKNILLGRYDVIGQLLLKYLKKRKIEFVKKYGSQLFQ